MFQELHKRTAVPNKERSSVFSSSCCNPGVKNMTVDRRVFKMLTGVMLAASFVMTGSLVGGRFEGIAIANSKTQDKKLAADLEDVIGSAPDGLVRVIIDTAPSPGSAAYSQLIGRIVR